MPYQGSFAMKIPPPNENHPILSVLPNQSVSYTCYTQVKVHTVPAALGYINQLKGTHTVSKKIERRPGTKK